MIRCDICHVRPAVVLVPMLHGHGEDYGRPSGNAGRMCRPCALAVLDKYAGPYIWPRHENGVAIWLEPNEVPPTYVLNAARKIVRVNRETGEAKVVKDRFA